MRKEVFLCDTCGEERKEANHWWLVISDRGSGLSSGDGMFRVEKWNHFAIANAGVKYKHYCGRNCVIKAMSKWMDEATMEDMTCKS